MGREEAGDWSTTENSRPSGLPAPRLCVGLRAGGPDAQLLLLGSPLAQPCRILEAVGSGFPDKDRFGRLKCLCELKLLPLPVAS